MEPDAHWKKPVPGYDARVPVWKRFLALVIDIIVFDLVVATPLTTLVPVSFTPTPAVIAVGTVLVALFFAYVVGAQHLVGQTVGMLFMRYRATNTDALWRCILRNVFILPVFPFIILWVVDPLYLAFKGDRLTERWADSTVEALS